MRLVVPGLPTWPRVELANGVELRVEDQLVVTVRAVEPLPANAQRWAELQIARDVAVDRIAVRRTFDRELPGGWPVALLELDVQDGTGRVFERRLHAIYRFVGHGCSVVAAGAPAVFDARRNELERMMLAARIQTDDVVALSQVWAGLDVVDRSSEPAERPVSAAPGTALHEVDEIK